MSGIDLITRYIVVFEKIQFVSHPSILRQAQVSGQAAAQSTQSIFLSWLCELCALSADRQALWDI